MALVDLTVESLATIIGESVPELYLVIAKNSVMEMDEDTLSGLLGATIDEIREIQDDQLYKQVRLIVASEHAKGVAQRDASWDAIEEMALNNLAKRIGRESDPKFNLQVAAVANRAQRRIRETRDRVLDPAKAELKIPLRLSQRIVKRINNQGQAEVEETREISVLDGTAVNPSFAEVDQLLGLRGPAAPSSKGQQETQPAQTAQTAQTAQPESTPSPVAPKEMDADSLFDALMIQGFKNGARQG